VRRQLIDQGIERMISRDLRFMARTLSDRSVSGATPLECTSLAISLLSLANQADAWENTPIPPEKRNLVVIIGGKQSVV
jgi:hypothetical protein